MSEETLREIIAIAKKSKWNQIKKFVKFIISKTLKKDAGYSLTVFDVSINGKKRPKYDQIINNKEKINELDKITDFNHLSLYQATRIANNHINLSQNNGTIIFLAKYLGPSLNDNQIFDFSVNLDALDEPFFTIGNSKKINCPEFLKVINKSVEPVSKEKKEVPKKKPKEVKFSESQNIEAFVFEKLTKKNAIWNGSETTTFKKWKAKTKNKYRIETGKISHYKGKPTIRFSQYLKSLLKNEDVKKKKLKKIIEKKNISSKIDEKELSEQNIFETITGKNAIWNEVETKNFMKWKDRIQKRYKKDTGKNPYYNHKLTKYYKNYLIKTFKIPPTYQKK